MRLIDADKLFFNLIMLLGTSPNTKTLDSEKVFSLVQNAPVLTNIDVIKEFPSIVNSPRGVWEIVEDDGGLKLCECSICGRREEIINFKNYPFCHCGAQMSPGGNK